MNIDDENTAAFSASTLERFDAICVQFEKDWQANSPARIEDAVHGFDGNARSALLLELLLLDVEYRTRAGRAPTAVEYESRFPGESAVIAMALRSDIDTDREDGDTVSNPQKSAPPASIDLSHSFDVGQLHARGGIGVVYRARDQKLKRDVAVKFPRIEGENSVEQFRLQREAEITGRLEHPGIVPVYATTDSQEGRPCFVMQFVQGPTLKAAIRNLHEEAKAEEFKKFDSLQFRQLLQRFVNVCHAVSYAHQQGVIHRDIKPSNIMLGKFGETYLLDWGLAKVLGEEEAIAMPAEDSPARQKWPLWRGSSKTAPGQPLGTPEYASPEQVMGKVEQHDERSDIYSLGATLYSLLAGKRPIEIDELTNLQTAAALRNIVPPRDHDAAIPRHLESICMKSMSFEPAARYQSVELMREDLERYLADEPVTVVADSWKTKLRRWSRKHPRKVASMAAALMVAVLSLAVGSYLLGITNRELGRLNTTVNDKNRELIQTNADLEVAKNRALTAKEKTLAAFRDLSDHVIEKITSQKVVGLKAQDRELLTNGLLERYVDLTQFDGDDLETDMMRIEGNYRIGELYYVLDHHDKASAYYETAIRLGTPLLTQVLPEVRKYVAQAHSNCSFMLSAAGDRAEADRHLEASSRIFSELAAEFPNEINYQNGLMQCQLLRANRFRVQARTQETIEQYEIALRMIEGLLKEKPRSRGFLMRKGTTHSHLGTQCFAAGNYERATIENQAAIDIYSDLAERYPEVPIHRRNLSIAKVNLGISLQRHKSQQAAIEQFEEAILIGRRLVDMNPKEAKYLQVAASAFCNLGKIYIAKKDYELAKTNLDAATDLARQAIKLAPNAIDDSRLLFISSLNTAILFMWQSLYDEAEAAFDATIEIAKSDLKKFGRWYHISDLCEAYSNKAQFMTTRQRLVEASKFYEKAVLLYGQIPEPVRRNANIRKRYRQDVSRFGWSLMNTGDYNKAADTWELFLELDPSKKSGRTTQTIRAVCIANFDAEKALEEVEKISKMDGLLPVDLYNLACASARASAALSDTTQSDAIKQAFLYLELAQKGGYFDAEGKVDRLRTNRSFESLHGTERFREYLKSLEPADGSSTDRQDSFEQDYTEQAESI